MTHFRCFSITLAIALMTVCAPASAQSSKSYDETIARAVAEFDHGNWEEARALFRRAHDSNPNARTWRSLGVTAFELRRYVDAIAELEAALADPRKPLTPKQRDEVQGLLSRAREFVSVYRVRIAPEDAEVIVDGKATTLTDGKLFLDPGQHTVMVRAGGYQERREDLSVAAGTQEELSIELSTVGEPSQAPEESPRVEAQPEPTQAPILKRRRVWTWVLGGTALAFAGAGVGTGLAARGKVDDYEKCKSSCGAVKNEGQRLQTMTNVAFGLSGALLAGAVVAFFLEGRSDDEPSTTSAWLAPDGVGLVHRF